MKTNFSPETIFFGIDVASQELVIARYPQSNTQAISNDKTGIKNWLQSLPAKSVIGVEATGAYHQLLIDMAHAACVQCYVLNPKDVKYYAKSTGARAKTDAVDACLIARYIAKEHMELHLWQPAPEFCKKLDELLKRRAKLVQVNATILQSFAGLAGLKDDINQVRERIKKLLVKMDDLIRKAATKLPDGELEHARLQAIPGVGLLTSSYLLSTFTRLPFRNSDAVVAFAGLDPRANDSGNKVGRRKLSKRGPAEMRRLLYNAAMSGSKTATWNPMYERARAAGKTTTEALIIIARKLLRVAFGLFKTHGTFDASKLGQAST